MSAKRRKAGPPPSGAAPDAEDNAADTWRMDSNHFLNIPIQHAPHGMIVASHTITNPGPHGFRKWRVTVDFDMPPGVEPLTMGSIPPPLVWWYDVAWRMNQASAADAPSPGPAQRAPSPAARDGHNPHMQRGQFMHAPGPSPNPNPNPNPRPGAGIMVGIPVEAEDPDPADPDPADPDPRTGGSGSGMEPSAGQGPGDGSGGSTRPIVYSKLNERPRQRAAGAAKGPEQAHPPGFTLVGAAKPEPSQHHPFNARPFPPTAQAQAQAHAFPPTATTHAPHAFASMPAPTSASRAKPRKGGMPTTAPGPAAQRGKKNTAASRNPTQPRGVHAGKKQHGKKQRARKATVPDSAKDDTSRERRRRSCEAARKVRTRGVGATRMCWIHGMVMATLVMVMAMVMVMVLQL